MMSTIVDRLGESNPQLFRELKGRLKPRNLAIATAISLVVQLAIYIWFRSDLTLAVKKSRIPSYDAFHRYCVGNTPADLKGYAPYPYGNNNYCTQDLLGNWMLDWQLWWLDIFTCLSVIGIVILLTAGVYLLIADLSREERRGTLNFIRLSPQSAKSILVGKILGIPILVYLIVGLGLPLHLIAGLSARIPLGLILAFYGVVAASCAFFYSFALLFGLVTTGLGGFQPWLASGVVLSFLFVFTAITMSGAPIIRSPFDAMTLLYPGTVLTYLIHATYLPPAKIGYFALNSSDSYSYYQGLVTLRWYGQSLWENVGTCVGFMLLQFGWWTYWIWQGLKRRFHDPLATYWTKGQSYLISGGFIAILLGFSLQTTESQKLLDSFFALQAFVMLFFLILIAGMSPQRQTLQDWSRYRHQMSRERRNLLKELIWGEKSPATVAIAINATIAIAFILPSIWLFSSGGSGFRILTGTLLNLSMILLYAASAQLFFMMKSQKRVAWASVSITTLIFLPLAIVACFASNYPATVAPVGLFSLVAFWSLDHVSMTTICLSLLAQWVAIALVNIRLTKVLQKAGESKSKALSQQRSTRALVGS
jgi:hypothetical protein